MQRWPTEWELLQTCKHALAALLNADESWSDDPVPR